MAGRRRGKLAQLCAWEMLLAVIHFVVRSIKLKKTNCEVFCSARLYCTNRYVDVTSVFSKVGDKNKKG